MPRYSRHAAFICPASGTRVSAWRPDGRKKNAIAATRGVKRVGSRCGGFAACRASARGAVTAVRAAKVAAVPGGGGAGGTVRGGARRCAWRKKKKKKKKTFFSSLLFQPSTRPPMRDAASRQNAYRGQEEGQEPRYVRTPMRTTAPSSDTAHVCPAARPLAVLPVSEEGEQRVQRQLQP